MQDDNGLPEAEGLIRRRTLMKATMLGLGGAAVGQLTPLAIREAEAAAADPNAGPLVTPDPIKARIAKGTIAVELVPFSSPPPSNGPFGKALLNTFYPLCNGSGRVFTNDSTGKLWELDRVTGAATLVLDLAAVRGAKLLTTTRHLGFRSFAFHPDFSRKGQPGYGKLYTVSVEKTAKPSGVAIFDGKGAFTVKFQSVVAEWTVTPGTPLKVNPSSRRELLRSGVWDDAHNIDQLMFNPNAKPGEADYGMMYMGAGDGGNRSSKPDPYNMAQNPGVVLGKLLRINPVKQSNGKPYGMPSDNPFVGKTGYLPEIWAVGLRHPQNLGFDRGGDGTFILIDVGQAHMEEVNLGRRGANYGWSLREGTFVTDRATANNLYVLPADDAKYGFVYPVAQYDHSEGKAIVGGYVYRGSAVPTLAGQYLFGDLVNGRVFYAPVASFVLGKQATIKELVLKKAGVEVTLMQLVGGSSSRVDLRFGQDEAGEVYIMTKQEGVIYKLKPA